MMMRTIFKTLLAVLPLALFAGSPAQAATESWRQSCSGPEYVCGGQATANKPAFTKATTNKFKSSVAKSVAKSDDADAPVKAKAKKAKVAKVNSDDNAPVKAKPKKAKVAKADTGDEAPVKAKSKKAKVAKSNGDEGGSSYQSGVASWYGGNFNGRKTANGETYDMWEMTAAHKTLPFGTRVKVTNTNNGNSTIVRINDRGPFVGGRVIDLSRAAANDIGMGGLAPVKLTILGKG